MASLLASLGLEPHLPVLALVLPVGISFYTFQTLSYTIDIYRERVKPTRSLVDYLAYVSFFPRLVAGPIERAGRLLPQLLGPRTFDLDDARDGARQMLWGAFKKLVVADNVAAIVNVVYADPEGHAGPVLVLATVLFAFQIYADFSAYSDIAIGTARLFGIRLCRNFAYPYFASSMDEFWRRWHISLSTWFRDYVYIPLGGNRHGRWRQALNLVTTFTVSGFWHGASWNFLIWGAINGLAVIPYTMSSTPKASAHDVPGGERFVPGPRVLAGMALTFALTCTAWVFFRAETLADATFVLGHAPTGWLDPASWSQVAGLLGGGLQRMISVPAICALVAIEWVFRRHPHPLHALPLPRPVRWVVYTGLLWSTIALQGSAGEFIYFQF